MSDLKRPVDTANATEFATDLPALNEAVMHAFPRMSRSGSQLGLALYEQLLKGAAVRREDLAGTAEKPTREVVAILEEPGMQCQVLYDEARSIVGFAGLAIAPTAHTLRVGDSAVFTWCVWDSFFIPPLLGVSAELTTVCPSCQSSLRVAVNATDVTVNGLAKPVMSFAVPDASCCRVTEDSISSFCDRVSIFCSRRCAGTWLRENDEFFLLSLHEAFELGLLYNASRFGASSHGGNGQR